VICIVKLEIVQVREEFAVFLRAHATGEIYVAQPLTTDDAIRGIAQKALLLVDSSLLACLY
jgi:hypothetical protein